MTGPAPGAATRDEARAAAGRDLAARHLAKLLTRADDWANKDATLRAKYLEQVDYLLHLCGAILPGQEGGLRFEPSPTDEALERLTAKVDELLVRTPPRATPDDGGGEGGRVPGGSAPPAVGGDPAAAGDVR